MPLRTFARLAAQLLGLVDDQTRWIKARWLFLGLALGLGTLMVLQTTVIYSPRLLINALYQGRQVGLQEVRSMIPVQRERLLKTLKYLDDLYHAETGEPKVPDDGT